MTKDIPGRGINPKLATPNKGSADGAVPPSRFALGPLLIRMGTWQMEPVPDGALTSCFPLHSAVKNQALRFVGWLKAQHSAGCDLNPTQV